MTAPLKLKPPSHEVFPSYPRQSWQQRQKIFCMAESIIAEANSVKDRIKTRQSQARKKR